MREEQAASIRARYIKLFVGMPAFVAILVWSAMAAFSDDQTTAMIGNTVASSLLFVLWKVRKHILPNDG